MFPPCRGVSGYQGITACATASTFARFVTHYLWGRAAELPKEGAACLSSHPPCSAANSGSWRSHPPGGAARSAPLVGCTGGGTFVGTLLLLDPLCGLCCGPCGGVGAAFVGLPLLPLRGRCCCHCGAAPVPL